MSFDNDLDLIRLFDGMHEPAHDEDFVEGVFNRIRQRRYFRYLIQGLLAIAALGVFAAIKSWLISIAAYTAFGFNLVAGDLAMVMLSPVGWAIGIVLGLSIFLKTQS